MSNLYIVFSVAAIAGFILIWMGSSGERQGKEPPPLAQAGYLALIIGSFGLLAQFMSFAAAMLSFLLLAGGLMLADRLWLKKRRGDRPRSDAVEYAYSFFPIILVVFLVRSFVAEPFQIPSSSMRPGLIPGDYILVSKFSYGLRLPILNKVIVPIDTPQRGDVMVFEFPLQRSTNYIKRLIGVPGDVIEYRDKKLFVNDVEQPQALLGQGKYVNDGATEHVPNSDGSVSELSPPLMVPDLYEETLSGKKYKIFVQPDAPAFKAIQVANMQDSGMVNFPDNCQYDMEKERWFRCTVPSGHYFVLGDNRDNSGDGRYWGFVPDNHIVGKAFFIWLNFGDFSRIGTRIQ